MGRAWHDTPLARRLGLRVPLVQAPMAGGWAPPRLVAAVCEAGGLGSLAGAMSPPDVLRADIRAVRALTDRPFAVNLFAALPEPTSRGLAEWAAVTGTAAPAEPPPVPVLADQLAVVAEERVAVLSSTFGLVPHDGLDAFTIGTATSVAEAVALEQHGVDAVVAQGAEAGGHRGSFLEPAELVGTLALVPQVVDAVGIPVIAAGGIADGRGLAAVLLLGAQAGQLGTAFLAADEAGTDAAYRQALGRPTTVTRVLTGRAARAVHSPHVEALEASGAEPPDYPLPRAFRPGPTWLAGQAGGLTRAVPAAQVVADTAAQATAALAAYAP